MYLPSSLKKSWYLLKLYLIDVDDDGHHLLTRGTICLVEIFLFNLIELTEPRFSFRSTIRL